MDAMAMGKRRTAADCVKYNYGNASAQYLTREGNVRRGMLGLPTWYLGRIEIHVDSCIILSDS